MKIRVLIVEDDPITRLDLKETLSAEGFEVSGTAASFEQAYKLFRDKKPDVLLVDIKLQGELDGIEFVKVIKEESDVDFPTVYLSANSDRQTRTRAFETNPSIFLNKPFNSKDLLISLELAFNNYSDNNDLLFIKTADDYIKIAGKDILFVQADGSYCKIVTSDNSYMMSINLNRCADKMKEGKFIRVHRSFLLNIEKITAVNHQNAFIGQDQFPIGRKYKENVIGYISENR